MRRGSGVCARVSQPMSQARAPLPRRAGWAASYTAAGAATGGLARASPRVHHRRETPPAIRHMACGRDVFMSCMYLQITNYGFIMYLRTRMHAWAFSPQLRKPI